MDKRKEPERFDARVSLLKRTACRKEHQMIGGRTGSEVQLEQFTIYDRQKH